MGKWTIPAIIIGAALLIMVALGGTYNSLVAGRENVNKMGGNLQSAYQMRNDLIPNLVKTVEGSANFEKSTLTQVTEARNKATQVTLPKDATPEQIKAYQDAQNGVTSSLGRLIAVAESYPDIKSTTAFLGLMDSLAGTEARINTARKDYNDAVQPFNQKVQTFPTNIVAGVMGFRTLPYFEADANASKAPTVNFGQ